MADIICRWQNFISKHVMEVVNVLPHQEITQKEFRELVKKSDLRFYKNFGASSQWASQLALYCELNDGYYHPRFNHDITEEDAEKYLKNWIKHYYIPNPFNKVGSFEKLKQPVCVLSSLYEYAQTHQNCNYKEACKECFFEDDFGNLDILKNVINRYSDILEINDADQLIVKQLTSIENKDLIIDRNDKKGFFDFFSKRVNMNKVDQYMSLDIPGRQKMFYDFLEKEAKLAEKSCYQYANVHPNNSVIRSVVLSISHKESLFDVLSIIDAQSIWDKVNKDPANKTQNNALSATISNYKKFLDYLDTNVSAVIKQNWIFPSNESKFRLTNFFEKYKQIDWFKGDTKCAIGDIVYVYCSGGEGRIKFKAKVIDNDVSAQNCINDKEYWVDQSEYEVENGTDTRYIRLELEGSLAQDDFRLSLNKLHELGVNGSMQGRRKVPNEALAEIEAVFNTPNTASIKETKAFQIMDAVNAVKETGLIYSDLLIKRFATSLLTKPFVILSGLAGSGKTQLAIAFAKAMVENEDEQLRVVSVGADWTNREPLLGYPNALKTGEYVHPESGALDILINANKNPDKPYFLILDEMNLSYVERYFADFLSAMESHQEIPLWKQDGNETPKSVKLPKNVFVIGTINVDETTYMFSPKVLDRANVIEFKVSEKDMDEFLANAQPIDVDSVSGVLSSEAADFVTIASEKTEPSSIANDVLKKFFSQLKTVNAEFGYRTASEIGRFIGLAKQVAGMADDEAIDCAIVQKLLPKLHGSRKKIVPVLKELWSLCETGDKIDEKTSMEVPKGTKYSLSADKILRMYQCAIDNGFTSFAEA